MKKYQIIYADPPWSYSFSGTRKNKNDDYKTMKTSDICNLPIKNISDNNCVLFIWMIWNKLSDCLKVINDWGFEYKNCAFTWVKRNKNSHTWFWGMGGWTRQNSEICLIATKGNPKRINADVHSIIDCSVGDHSDKPDEVKKRITDLIGDLPRIELFARRKNMFNDGWDIWGNEVESDIEL